MAGACIAIVVAGAFVAFGPWRGGTDGTPELERPAAAVPAPDAAPSFDVVRIEPDGSAVIAGRAAPGSTVTILDGGKPVGTVTADARGEWVLVPGTAMPPGARELTLQSTTPAGGQLASGDAVVLVVPEPKRDVAGRRQAETGEALAVLTPKEGPSRLLQAPGSGKPAADGQKADGQKADGQAAVTLDTVDYDREGRVGVGGRARPGAEVQLYLDNTLVGRTKADGQGRWALSPDRLVEPGTYELRADQLGPDGAVAARAAIAFDRRPLGADALGGKAVVVLPGNNLWTIARRTYGDGVQFTTIFQANQGQIRDPNLIYPGQIFVVPEERKAGG